MQAMSVLGLIGAHGGDAVARESHLQCEEDDALDLSGQERYADLAEVHLGLISRQGLEAHRGALGELRLL
jgi:hypothetical protein